MYSDRKPTIILLEPAPEPTAEVLALVARMRALSLADKELARLMEDLEPLLPKAADPTRDIQSEDGRQNYETSRTG